MATEFTLISWNIKKAYSRNFNPPNILKNVTQFLMTSNEKHRSHIHLLKVFRPHRWMRRWFLRQICTVHPNISSSSGHLEVHELLTRYNSEIKDEETKFPIICYPNTQKRNCFSLGHMHCDRNRKLFRIINTRPHRIGISRLTFCAK